MPPSPDSAPEAITAIRRTRLTSMPAASTAWGLSPQARRCRPNLVLYRMYQAMTAIRAMAISKGYRFVNTAPSTGIFESTGTVMRADTPSTNLLEAAPKMLALSCLVRNSVSAMARMLITTPLITWLALNLIQSMACSREKSIPPRKAKTIAR